MAGSRAAASVSLTIGIAVATLLVAGGILAGPSILDCSHQSVGIGACLGARAAALLRQQPSPPSHRPMVAIDLPPPPLMAPQPQRPQGWLEANANEYEAPLSAGSVLLVPPAGVVAAGGKISPAPDAAAQIALSQPPGRLGAAGRTLSAVPDREQVALAQPAGRLDASGAVVAKPDGAIVDLRSQAGSAGASGIARLGTLASSADVAVISPPGHLALAGLGAPATGASALAEPAAVRGLATTTGSVTSAATTHGAVALEAEAEIPAAVPAPEAAVSAAPPLLPPPRLVAPKPPKAAAVGPPPDSGPRRIIKADPRYPNVLVLPPPPPIAGANSSFTTLQLR